MNRAVGTFQHPIQVVARLTGLSPHVIRVWEKRYSAVVPARTNTNRRLYSDEEVERLRLLARATEGGHKIGLIARLELEELRRLVRVVHPGNGWSPTANGLERHTNGRGEVSGGTARAGGEMGPRSAVGQEMAATALVGAALSATTTFSAEGLLRVLEEGTVRLGHSGVLCRVVGPLAQELGERWQRGQITAAHEHFASAIIREFLIRASRPFALGERAPRAVVTTPAGQLHELGAVMAAAVATNLGWRAVYLGASLPAAEIAGATLQNDARAVLLSLVYPEDDPHVPGELRDLRKYLPAGVEVVAGGRAVRYYAGVLREIGALVPGDLEELSHLLEEIRRGPSPEAEITREGGGVAPTGVGMEMG